MIQELFIESLKNHFIRYRLRHPFQTKKLFLAILSGISPLSGALKSNLDISYRLSSGLLGLFLIDVITIYLFLTLKVHYNTYLSDRLY